MQVIPYYYASCMMSPIVADHSLPFSFFLWKTVPSPHQMKSTSCSPTSPQIWLPWHLTFWSLNKKSFPGTSGIGFAAVFRLVTFFACWLFFLGRVFSCTSPKSRFHFCCTSPYSVPYRLLLHLTYFCLMYCDGPFLSAIVVKYFIDDPTLCSVS